MLSFSIEAKIPGAKGRAGVIKTPHGDIQTPAFIPVGTKATIKSLTPEQVASLGADAILANTYHLYLQPGTEVLKKAGGLGKFMNWKGPTFTDSGGFQAFSLGPAFGGGSKIGRQTDTDEAKKDMGSDTLHRPLRPSIAAGQQAGTRVSELMSDEAKSVKLAKIDDDGVTFKSIIDGSTHRFTPERSIEIQHAIGADIIFAFDECLSPQESYEKQKAAVERTHAWAQRCLDAHRKADVGDSFSGRFGPSEGEGEPAATRPRVDGVSRKILSRTSALFGIVQGGRHEDLRRHSAKTIGSMDFDGFGIGGSFDKDDIGTAVGWVCEELPENKPRHLLGIGEPEDLILGIENGIDTFDCVAPTRIARNGAAYIKGGRINLFNAQFVSDFTSIEKDCGCYTCTNYTKAYLAHLFRAKEMLAATLTSIHNLYFLVHLVKNARKAIVEGKWGEFRRLHT
jgi:queuine tRNA-ribosyltransferase